MLLNLSMGLAVWSNDCRINSNTKILCSEDMFQADHEVQHLQKTVFYLFGREEKNHYCTVVRCRSLCGIKEKNFRYYGAKTLSQCRSPCKPISCQFKR
ncbi:uncharacterized protein TNCV_4614911 [Trichonephila clavipes]|nr:uncharacterized protein TNCV_4614911 [Trichonephila clavipes]